MIAYQLVWFLREDPVEVNLRQEKNHETYCLLPNRTIENIRNPARSAACRRMFLRGAASRAGLRHGPADVPAGLRHELVCVASAGKTVSHLGCVTAGSGCWKKLFPTWAASRLARAAGKTVSQLGCVTAGSGCWKKLSPSWAASRLARAAGKKLSPSGSFLVVGGGWWVVAGSGGGGGLSGTGNKSRASRGNNS